MAYEAFLSQDEVDALLAGVTGEEQSGAPAADNEPPGTRAYDLSSPERVVRRRMQTLELINERFARHLRTVLLNFMRRSADITVSSIRIQKYADFERNIPVPSNLNMVQLRPLRGTAMLSYDASLVFLVVDSLFGGDGRYHMRVEGGRTFEDRDNATAQPVALVNREFVRKYLPGQDAIGTHLDFGGGTPAVIVGIVANTPQNSGAGDFGPLATTPTVYVPSAQTGDKGLAMIYTWFSPNWIVRTRGPAGRIIPFRVSGAVSFACRSVGADRNIRHRLPTENQCHQRLCWLHRLVEFLFAPDPQPSGPGGLAGFQRSRCADADGNQHLPGDR